MAAGKKTGGRQKGTPNKVTADIKALVEPYSAKAIAKLAWLMGNGDTHQVQLAAAREIMDRAYGKPAQTVAVSGELDHTHSHQLSPELAELVDDAVEKAGSS